MVKTSGLSAWLYRSNIHESNHVIHQMHKQKSSSIVAVRIRPKKICCENCHSNQTHVRLIWDSRLCREFNPASFYNCLHVVFVLEFGHAQKGVCQRSFGKTELQLTRHQPASQQAMAMTKCPWWRENIPSMILKGSCWAQSMLVANTNKFQLPEM